MKPAPFAYAKARSLDEAIALLGEHADARLLAGGQSLIATLNMRLSAPALLIDINGIGGLDGIAHKDGDDRDRRADAPRRRPSAPTTIAQHAPLIARAHAAYRPSPPSAIAARSAARSPLPIRRRNCRPACWRSTARSTSPGRRASAPIKADDFFKGLFETALGPQDMLTAIRVPAASKDTRIGFAELARRHGDYAIVGLAASARADGKGLSDVRLAYFGVGATPLRARKVGSRAGRAAMSMAAVAALDLDPHDDVQATGAVKKHLAGVLLRRVASAIDGAAAMSEHALDISLTVNGEPCAERVEARKTLVDFLRDDLALTGSHVGCEHGVCGACTVRVDGEIVRGCLMLAAQCDGAKVETIEGLSDTGEIADLQAAFEQRNALQCGFCTPGMLLTAQDLLAAAAACRAATKSASTSPAITAAAPATRPSSTRSKRWRKRARERSDENHRRLPARLTALDRPNSYIGRSVPRPNLHAAHARARAICQRRHAAAHGACRLRALAARACAHRRRSKPTRRRRRPA